MKRILLLLTLFVSLPVFGQTPYGLMPIPRQQFFDASGVPLAGGCVHTYLAGTTTDAPTYTDASGTAQNTNPAMLDGGGFASIWLAPQLYKIVVVSAGGGAGCPLGVQQWTQDNVSNVGQILFTKSLLLAPLARAEQDVAGPVGADWFIGISAHKTSPGVRINLLDPSTIVDTLTNPFTIQGDPPAIGNQVVHIPDPGSPNSNFVINPVYDGTNTIDCTAAGLTCKRRVNVQLEGASCNNTTAALAFDSFGANSPVPLCVTGTNVQKGVMAMPAAATLLQQNSNTAAAAGTVAVAYPVTSTAHDLLVVELGFDGANTKTITGCTDGTNVGWTQAVHSVNGTIGFDIWYFNGDSVAVTGSVTCTFSANTDSAATFQEYAGITVTPNLLDRTATATGSGTAVLTGTTLGTSQNTELILAGMSSNGNPTIFAANGWNQHFIAAQSTNVSVDSEGMIQNATSTQAGAFTLGSSQTWAGGIATFKVTVASSIIAQRSFSLPGSYDTTVPFTLTYNWQSPQRPSGTVNVVLGSQITCTAVGNTDDTPWITGANNAFMVPNSVANTITTSALTVPVGNTAGPCAPGGLLHYQANRQRYDTRDTFEGFVFINNVNMNFGVSQ